MPDIIIAAVFFLLGAGLSWWLFKLSSNDDKYRHEQLLQELDTQKRTIEDLGTKLEEQSHHTVTMSALGGESTFPEVAATGNVLFNDDRPVTDEQRRTWIEEVGRRTDAFSTEWVGVSTDLKKFNLRWWNPYGLDAVNIELSFGDYDRMKLANKEYEAPRLYNGTAMGVFYAPDMGTPSPFPVIVTYSIEGDRYEDRLVWEGEYEG